MVKRCCGEDTWGVAPRENSSVPGSFFFQQLTPELNHYYLSQADLKTRILDFIDYFNRTMAKPFQWTYKGKALAV
jgi:hypothetical protein